MVAATDERQAGLCFGVAARMVELHDDLAARVQVFQDKLVVPAHGASFKVLPAVAKRLEGSTSAWPSWTSLGAWTARCTRWCGRQRLRRPASVAIGIGTPPPDPAESVLTTIARYVQDHPDDPSTVWRERSAAGFEDHPADCRHCWTLANPSLNDFWPRTGWPPACRPACRKPPSGGPGCASSSTSLRAPGCHPAPGRRARMRPARFPTTRPSCCPWTTASRATHRRGGRARRSAPPRRAAGVVGGSRGRERLAGARRRGGGRHPGSLPPLRGPRDRLRPVPLDPQHASTDDGLPVTSSPDPGPDKTGHPAFHEAVVNRQLTHSDDTALARHAGQLRGPRGCPRYPGRQAAQGFRRKIDAAVAAIMALAAAAT